MRRSPRAGLPDAERQPCSGRVFEDWILGSGLSRGLGEPYDIRYGYPRVNDSYPRDLIADAVKGSGKNITDTIKEGLEIVKAGNAFRGLLKMRGKEKIKLNVKTLRKDR